MTSSCITTSAIHLSLSRYIEQSPYHLSIDRILQILASDFIKKERRALPARPVRYLEIPSITGQLRFVDHLELLSQQGNGPCGPVMVWRLTSVRSWLLLGSVILIFSTTSSASNDGNWTVKHEAGRCAIKGHCGKQSFFGGQLPCPNNGLADEPDKELRKKVVDLCGSKWSEGKMCCNDEQVSSCPALRSDETNDLSRSKL